MEPMEFIKTGEDGTSLVLNEAALKILKNIKKPLVSIRLQKNNNC